jgi:hypothetical protein
MPVGLYTVCKPIKVSSGCTPALGCQWVDTPIAPVDTTTEVGHCEIAPVTSTTPAGTADACYPIMDKAGCLPTIGCNWTYTPKAPVNPSP